MVEELVQVRFKWLIDFGGNCGMRCGGMHPKFDLQTLHTLSDNTPAPKPNIDPQTTHTCTQYNIDWGVP